MGHYFSMTCTCSELVFIVKSSWFCCLHFEESTLWSATKFASSTPSQNFLCPHPKKKILNEVFSCVSNSMNWKITNKQTNKQHNTYKNMFRYGTVWPLMVLYGLIWSSMVLYGPVRSQMVPYGPRWSHLVHMSPYGPVWSSMGPYGPVWSHMVQ